MINALLRDFERPEYLHVLLNPLPVYGLGIALFGLIAALLIGSRRGQIAALLLVSVTAAAAWPVAEFGEDAYRRVLSMADAPGKAWLKTHADRAQRLIYPFYALALIAAIAILAPKKWPKTARPLAIATLVLAVFSLGAGCYVAYAGGKIRHQEFRNTIPSSTLK